LIDIDNSDEDEVHYHRNDRIAKLFEYSVLL